MRKKIIVGFLVIILSLTLVVISDYFLAVEQIKTEYCDLTEVLQKEKLTEEEYGLIFSQTGLGRPAVEDIRLQSSDFDSAIKAFQTQNLQTIQWKQDFIFFPTTTAEQLRDTENKEIERRLELPPLKKGDILLTRSTKTLLYRHGHSALLLDPEREKTVEALMIGSDSDVLRVDSWRYYPTLLVLRPKNIDEKTVEKVTSYAEEKLVGVPYHLLTGVLKKDKTDLDLVDYTHCAHLVWQAYQQAGIDLDSDEGWMVTPRDIANSSELEVVFSFGFGDDGGW
ncbi:MAG: hypothetical protein E7403_02100 [Ruminococcaceae bacterium]|nr:hypothetical protein [Oscillospiraceae bacterium]